MPKKGVKAKVTKVKDNRNGLKKLLGGKLVVLVGIPEDALPYPDGTPVAQVAAQNEFGIGVPERSFMRSTLKENREKYIKDTQKAVKDEIQGKKELEKSLKQIGSKAASAVQNKITAIKTPPNSEATIKAKGSSNPLIKSEHMRSSVTYEVVKK